ncbi:hypothetical protein N9Z41_02625 [bacterium]|nr:hypothetical protein [bacterium]
MPLSFGGRIFNFDLDSVAKGAVDKLNLGATNTLKLSTDACNVMGTIGAIVPDQKTAVAAAEAEEKTTKMLTAISDSAGQLTEAVSEVAKVAATAETKAATVSDLASRLRSAGKPGVADELEQALTNYLDAVEGKVVGVNNVAGEGGRQGGVDIGSLVETAISEASSKMDEATAKLGTLVTASGGISCKGIQEAMLNTNFNPSGDAGEVGKTIKSKVPRHTRRIQSDGQLVNFNIDRKKPFRDVEETIQARNLDAGENEDPFTTKTTLIRVYGDQAQLDKRYGAKVEELPEAIEV